MIKVAQSIKGDIQTVELMQHGIIIPLTKLSNINFHAVVISLIAVDLHCN